MAQSVADEYKSSLADLNFNSKPHINMLTMLAEENVRHASVIVKTILDHIEKCLPEQKLPGLYLVDSIIKNVGKQYLSLFSQHLISLFASVFEKVEESTRSLLFKLRQTWNDLLPNKILYGLDLRVRKLDPAWPITAKNPNKSIHVNPKFLGSISEEKQKSAPDVLQSTSTLPTEVQTEAPSKDLKKHDDNSKHKHGAVLKQVLEKRDQLIEKKAQLRRLEMKKMEISAKKKSSNIMPVGTLNQNFKPNALRDPRMVKINKVSLNTPLPKPSAPSVCLNKIAPSPSNSSAQSEKKSVHVIASEASQKSTQSGINAELVQNKSLAVKSIPKLPIAVPSDKAPQLLKNNNDVIKGKSVTTSDKNKPLNTEACASMKKKVLLNKSKIATSDVKHSKSAKVHNVSNNHFRKHSGSCENEFISNSSSSKNSSVMRNPPNNPPEMSKKFTSSTNDCSSKNASMFEKNNMQNKHDASISQSKEGTKPLGLKVIANEDLNAQHHLMENMSKSVSKDEDLRTAFSDKEDSCMTQKRKSEICDSTDVKNDQNEPPSKKQKIIGKMDSSDFGYCNFFKFWNAVPVFLALDFNIIF